MAEAVNVGAIEVRIDLLTADFKKSQDEIKLKLKELGVKSEESTSVFSRAWAKAASAVAGSYAGILAIALKTIQANVDLARSAESFGIAEESLGRWQASAKSAGVTADEFQKSVKTLYARMSERGATDEGVRIFTALGISVKDSHGKIKSLDQILPELAAKFSTMKDGVEKTRIATALLGEKGNELLGTLNKGPAALAAQQARMEALGIATSRGAVEASVKFNATLNELLGTYDAVVTATTNRVIPVLQDYADRLKTVADNGVFVKNSVELLVGVFKTFTTQIDLMISSFSKVEDAMRGAGKVMTQLANFEFGQARKTIVMGGADIVNSAVETGRKFKDGYGKDVGETITGVGEAFGDFAKKSAPVIRTSEEVAKSLERIKQMNQLIFEDIKGDNKLPLHEKIEALNQMLNENKITDLEYIKTIKDLNAELERETLQRTLDIDTVPIMTKMQALEDAKERGVIKWGEYSNSMDRVRKSGAQQMDDLASATSGALTSIFKKSKTAAIASALINTFQAISKANAAYAPPLSFAMMGIAAASGFAQVAAIRSQSESGGGGSSAGSSGAAAAQSAPQAPPAATQSTLTVQGINAKGLFTGDVVRSLADQLLQFQRDGGRVILT